MKLTAGLGRIEDFEKIADAGAKEIFCGYVPHEWNETYGTLCPLNRREVLFYSVQIGSLQDMIIIKKMADAYGVDVVVTWNALFYTQEQLEKIGKFTEDLIVVGIDQFIVADLGLLLYLKKKGIQCRIHVSGEIGEWNPMTVRLLKELFFESPVMIKRIIFHRKNTFADMDACIQEGKKWNPDMEYEAFFLNEMCHFTGGYCNSIHCDELLPMCQVPYEFVPYKKGAEVEAVQAWNNRKDEKEEWEDVLGQGGCGLCALWQLREIGITHLKIVGRGKAGDGMKKDVEGAQKAIHIMEQAKNEQEYKRKIKEHLFVKNCSKDCYYMV